MNIQITPQALSVIDAIADFVESKNTRGSGKRYALKFKSAIEKLALPNVQHSLCNHSVLAAHKYSCSHFNDWVIAFKIKDGKLIVYEIIHGSLLF
ncbi:MAG: type II toxin-antitoxin system RelE/ParE family toxin [Sphingobacteriales bacterium]